MTVSKTAAAFLLLAMTAPLLVQAQVTTAEWGLLLLNNNTWVSLDYTINVPRAPAADVTIGPWNFWCGLKSGHNTATIRPGLSFLQPQTGEVNPNPPFEQVWAVNLVTIPWYSSSTPRQSSGIWVDQGAQIATTTTAEIATWDQTAVVTSGLAKYNSTALATNAAYFNQDAGNEEEMALALCQSELYGEQTSEWNFPVTFTDVTLVAASSEGVQTLCSDTGDGTYSSVTLSGFSMPDEKTCYWESITLTPP